MKSRSAPQPLISVVLPVHNAAEFLTESIQSIQAQSYTEWELILVDDASTDLSLSIAQSFAKNDPRIKVLVNKTQQGVAQTANRAITKARGQYIARMDADDKSHPKRLTLQLRYLQKHPKTVAVGGQCVVINSAGVKTGQKTFPTEPKDVYAMAGHYLPIQQPCLMVNAGILPKNFVWYQNDFTSGEEHELLSQLFQFGSVANLNQTILEYRLHGKNTSMEKPKRDFFNILKTRIKAVREYGFNPTLTSLVINVLQLAVVLLVPERMIFRLYEFLRGISSPTQSATLATK